MKTNKEGTTSTLSKPSRTVCSFPKAFSTEKNITKITSTYIFIMRRWSKGRKKENKSTFQITSSLSSQISDSITNMSLTALFSISASLIYCKGTGEINFIGYNTTKINLCLLNMRGMVRIPFPLL